MKILLITICAMLIIATAASAVSIDNECQDNGFDFGIVKYEWSGNGYVAEDEPLYPYTFTLEGDAQNVDWTSNQPVDGVLRKASTETTVLPGGMSGTISGWESTNPKGKPVTHDISHVTFCGNEKPTNGVPEFSTGTFVVAIMLGTVGIMAIRRK